MDLAKYVGEQIKKFRERRNMTQDDLAERLGTTRQSISRYEIGERKANQDILFALSDIFGVAVNDFFPSGKRRNLRHLQSTRTTSSKKKFTTSLKEQLEEQQKRKRSGISK